MARRIKPSFTEHVLLQLIVSRGEGASLDRNGTGDGFRICRVKSHDAANALCITADRFERRIQKKGDIIDPLRVFEVVGFDLSLK